MPAFVVLSTPMIRRFAVWTAVVTAPFLMTAEARAGQFGSEYSWSQNCGDFSDPIGVLFYGSAAVGDYLIRNRRGHIYYHTGWKSYQYFGGREEDPQSYPGASRGCIDSYTYQPAEAPGPEHSRYHVRLFGLDADPFRDSRGNPVQLSTPHHEDWVYTIEHSGCISPAGGNHAVDKGAYDRGDADKPGPTHGSGFDQGRRKLMERFDDEKLGRHHITWSYWGNSRSKKQCDGDWAGSNGNVYWIAIGRYK